MPVKKETPVVMRRRYVDLYEEVYKCHVEKYMNECNNNAVFNGGRFINIRYGYIGYNAGVK